MENIEKVVLANIIKDVENLKLIKDKRIEAAYFQFPENRKLFEICHYYFRKYNKILAGDTLQSILRQSTKLSDDLKSKLTVLHKDVSKEAPASDFGLILDEFVKYYKINNGKRLLQAAAEHLHEKDPDKFLESIKTNLIKLNNDANSSSIERHFFGENADEIINMYHDKKLHPEKYRGVYMGFPSLDKVTNGAKAGQVFLFLGEMKSGKSVFMVNIAHNMINSGKRVYYHANEGGIELVEQRFTSRGTGIPLDKIEFGQMDKLEEQRYELYLRSFKDKDLFFVESSPAFFSSASHIESTIMELKAIGKAPDIILVDYLGLMQTDDKMIKSSWEKLGAITLELKSVAMNTKTPIVVIGHVNRKGMEKEKKDSYDLEDMGLSLEPLKHVDMIFSWKINDPDTFAINNIGEGTLKVIGSRTSKYPEMTLQINTNIMKIHELVLNIKH